MSNLDKFIEFGFYFHIAFLGIIGGLFILGLGLTSAWVLIEKYIIG